MVNVQQEIHKHGTLPLFLAAINREVSSSQYRGRGKGEDVKKKIKSAHGKSERRAGASSLQAQPPRHTHIHTHTRTPRYRRRAARCPPGAGLEEGGGGRGEPPGTARSRDQHLRELRGARRLSEPVPAPGASSANTEHASLRVNIRRAVGL